MANYALSVLGILVSVFTFFIGYRQTIGAKKERSAAANAQLERIVLRRIALENNSPTQADLERLIQGKAIDSKVSTRSLMSPGQLLTVVQTRVTESELIQQERREEILRNTSQLLDSLEPSSAPSTSNRPGASATLWFGVASSAIGVVVTALVMPHASPTNVHSATLKLLALTASGSVLTLAAIATFLNLRSSAVEVPSEEATDSEFTVRVLRVLNSLDPANVTVAPRTSGVDYIVTHRNRKFGIEVKNWYRRPPKAYRASLRNAAARTLKEMKLDAVAIVTPVPFIGIREFEGDTSIRFVTLDELRSFFS